MHPHKLRHLRRELPRIVNGTRRQLVRLEHAARDRDAMIVVAERRRLVHDARPRVRGDVGVDDDAEGLVFELVKSNCYRVPQKDGEDERDPLSEVLK